MNEVAKKFYYTIGEVSRLLDLKQHVIRYWETEFPQLHPKKDNGRNRKYSESDIDVLRMIKDMLYNQKYTIDGARQKLSRQSKNKKNDQMEFEFQNDELPVEKPVENPEIFANVGSNLVTLRSKLHDITQALHNFKAKWKINT